MADQSSFSKYHCKHCRCEKTLKVPSHVDDPTRRAQWLLTAAVLPAALPTLDVNEGALDTIFSVYKQLLPEMGGYLIQDGHLRHQRLELLLAKLAELELETLEQRASVSRCLNPQIELRWISYSAVCPGIQQGKIY